MSAISGGPGWFLATDGKWYPPERHPNYAAPAPPPPPDSAPGPGFWMATDGQWYPPERHPNYVAPPSSSPVPPSTASAPAVQGFGTGPIWMGAAVTRLASSPGMRSTRRPYHMRWWVIAAAAAAIILIATSSIAITGGDASGGSAGSKRVNYVDATLADMVLKLTQLPGFSAIPLTSIQEASSSSLIRPGSLASLPCLRGALVRDSHVQSAAAAEFVQDTTGMAVVEALGSFPSLADASTAFERATLHFRRCRSFSFTLAGQQVRASVVATSFPSVGKARQSFRLTVSSGGVSLGYDVLLVQQSAVDLDLLLGPIEPQSTAALRIARRAVTNIVGTPGNCSDRIERKLRNVHRSINHRLSTRWCCSRWSNLRRPSWWS